jgi:AraC-like DNA-binding protein
MVAASLSPQQIRIEADDRFYFLTLPRVGKGDYTTNGLTFSVGLGEGLLELPGESEQHIRYSTDVELAICSIPSATFEREAELLIGHPPPSPLEVFETIPRDSPLRRKINLALDELDRPNGLFSESPAAGLRWQHMLIAAIIEGTPNSWAPLIQKEETIHNVPHWHARRCKKAEEYMDAHLCDEIFVGDIAHAAGCKERALQKAFTYCDKNSPMAVLQNKRLKAAMRDLRNPDPNTTVESIARKYKFDTSLFPQYFFETFGCRPSDVLREARLADR